ncbi:hypothetical protein [Citrobacter meridianamericanus]|uniref:hypothetical protein n=1 Tax=Citrobacter meridianamericanus TaxID=2894201 RepID=UPI00351CC7B8
MHEKTTVVLPFNIYSHNTDKNLLIIGIKCHEYIQEIISSAFSNNLFDISVAENKGIILSASNYDFIFDLKRHLNKYNNNKLKRPSLLTFTFINKTGKLICGNLKFIQVDFNKSYTISRSDLQKNN